MATAAACHTAGLPTPVCVATRPGGEAGAVRGLRRVYLVAPPDAWGERTGDLVATARRDLRSGDAAILPVLAAVAAVHEAWRSAWRLVTASVRPGPMRLRDRVVPFGPLLPLAPLVGIGLSAAWLGVQLARLVVPARLVRRLLGWFGTDEDPRPASREAVVAADDLLLEQVAFAHTAVVQRPTTPVRRRWWSTPGALATGFDAGPLAGPVAVVVLVLVVWGASLSGLGAFPAQRIVWLGERAVPATAVDVRTSGEPDSVLGRLGVPIGVEYEVVARTDAGQELWLPSGTNPVEVGDRLTVVGRPEGSDRGPEVPLEQVRSRTQDSVASIVIIGGLLLAFGAFVLTVLWDLASLTTGAVRWAEYAQADAAGRRVRKPRSPWVTVLGS